MQPKQTEKMVSVMFSAGNNSFVSFSIVRNYTKGSVPSGGKAGTLPIMSNVSFPFSD